MRLFYAKIGECMYEGVLCCGSSCGSGLEAAAEVDVESTRSVRERLRVRTKRIAL